MLFSTALAAAGLVAQGISVVAGTVQGLKNRSNMLEAEAKASKALQEAKNYLQVNVYDKMGIAKEPFKLARDLTVQQGALALQSAAEGSARGAAAAAGGVQMSVMNQEAQNRAAMSEEQYALDLKSAAQEQENMQYMASLNLQEAEGAAKAAADADTAMMKSFAGAAQGVAGMLGQVSKMPDDIIDTVEARRALNLKGSYENALSSGKLSPTLKDSEGNPLGYEMSVLRQLNISDEEAAKLPIYSVTKDPGGSGTNITTLDPGKFQAWLETLDKSQLKPLIKGGFEAVDMNYDRNMYQRQIGRQINLAPF